jgi:hypothetical protein
MSQGSFVCVVTRLLAGQVGFDCQQGQEMFLLVTVCSLGPIQSFPKVKWIGCELTISIHYRGQEQVELSLHCSICLHGVVLSEHQGQLYSTFGSGRVIMLEQRQQ